MYSLYSRAASNQERPMMARVRYLTCPLSFLIGFFNSQTKEALKVEVCFMSASKIESKFEFSTMKKAVFSFADMMKKKRLLNFFINIF